MPPVQDTSVTDWSVEIDQNAPSDAATFAEEPLDERVRAIKSAVKGECGDKAWIRFGDHPAFVSPTSFTLTGDRRTTAAPGRRVKLTLSGTTKYATVHAATFSALTDKTTVTIECDPEQFAASTIGWDTDNALTTGPGDFTSTFAPLIGTMAEIWTSGVRFARRIVDVNFVGATLIDFASEPGFMPIPVTANAIMLRSSGIDATLSEVEWAAITPDLYQSGWGHGFVAGSLQIVANGTTGPFTVQLPNRMASPEYTVQLQALEASSTPSSTDWVNARIETRSNTSFSVRLPSAIASGPTLSFGFLVAFQS